MFAEIERQKFEIKFDPVSLVIDIFHVFCKNCVSDLL